MQPRGQPQIRTTLPGERHSQQYRLLRQFAAINTRREALPANGFAARHVASVALADLTGSSSLWSRRRRSVGAPESDHQTSMSLQPFLPNSLRMLVWNAYTLENDSGAYEETLLKPEIR